MKMEFTHTGNIHDLVMAMLQDNSYTLSNSEGKTLEIKPRIKDAGFSIKSGSCNSQMIMTIPVTVKDFTRLH